MAPLVRPSTAVTSAAPLVGGETIIIIEGGEGADAQAPHRARALGEAPFVTIVEAADRRGQLLSVAEALSATVGASVRSSGGVGASSTLSLRGAASGHTGIAIDGIPLSRLTSVSVDLGRFQLDDFDAVEVYRGNVPSELGGAGVGGAVNLVTHLGPARDGARVRALAGAGSYGARRAAVRVGDRWLGHDLTLGAGYLAADGDYQVFSDAGTPLNREDDSWQVRRNNEVQHLDVNARVGTAEPGSEAQTVVGGRASWQRHGLPGLVAAPALHASLSTAFAMLDVDDQRPVAGWAVRTRGYGTLEWQRFRDRQDEVGLAAQDREYLTVGVGASSSWKRLIGAHQAQLGAEVRVERFRDRDRWMDDPTAHGARQTLGMSLGDELAAGSWLLAAALRVELSRTEPALIPDRLMMPLPTRVEVLPSPRVTARVLAEPDLAVKASAGWYARQPTLVELFGDRGFLVGTPELRAETGPSVDLGLVWSPARASGPFDRVLIETAGYFNHASDAIVFVNTGYVARPTNVGAAANVGLEVAASSRLWRTLQVVANYSLEYSEQQEAEESFDGKALPRHPRHTLYARLEATGVIADRNLRGFADLQATSESYLDRANLQRVPARQLIGAGVSLELGMQLTLAFEVRNLLDRQVEQFPLEPAPRPDFTSTPVAISDISGLPLPGRNLFLSLEWSH